MTWQILQGDNRQTLKTIADDSIDAIVTDPPYGIDFLGKDWDANTGALETYQECLRVLKPGGHILAFSAARTYHHLAVTLEQAGFEIRDQIMWIYSSGFPKSQDVGRSIQRSLGVKELDRVVDTTKNAGFGQTDHARVRAGEEWSTRARAVGVVKCTDPEAQAWSGWGTALKPAHEPICLARKPMRSSIAKNCQEWGVGALNIDACRVPYEDVKDMESAKGFGDYDNLNRKGGPSFRDDKPVAKYKDQKKSTKPKIGTMGKSPPNLNAIGTPSLIETSDQPWIPSDAGRFPSNVIGEIPLYQKYFYCPKVSRKERHMGFNNLPDRLCGPGGDDWVQAQDHQRSNAVITHWEMVAAMGGYYVDENGNRDDERAFGGKNIYLPHKGMIFGHGLKHEYAEWCKANGKRLDNVGNNHPTVKPIELMKYLIKLITPAGGTVLDPFAGSGSTGMAAVELGHTFVGCELDAAYVAIANQRIQAWLDLHTNPDFDRLFEMADD